MKLLPVARLAYGAPLLFASGVVLRMISGGRADGIFAAMARILGSRHVAQALTLDRARSRGWVLLGARVDLLHALSMAGAAVLSRDYRRAVSLDAALALGMCACGLLRVRYG